MPLSPSEPLNILCKIVIVIGRCRCKWWLAFSEVMIKGGVGVRMIEDTRGAKFYSLVVFGQFGNCTTRSSRNSSSSGLTVCGMPLLPLSLGLDEMKVRGRIVRGPKTHNSRNFPLSGMSEK